MSQDTPFDALLEALRRRDPDAERGVFERFARRLIVQARLHLDGRLRQKVDPEDVVQSAFRSFFLRFAGGQFDLRSWDGLWSLLIVITLRKCGNKVEHYHAACRSVLREVSPAEEEDSSAGWQAVAREPTPAEAAALADTVEGLMSGLDECRRGILALSLQGHGPREISEQLGCSERMVYRLREQVKRQLERLRDETAA
jgi:RNA polymerase sigma-70 factor (ECF subfamily)